MPEGERVKNGLTFVQGFWRNRGPMVVRLLRNIDDNSTTNGIYKCRMLDDDSISHSYHVGLYNEGEGSGYRHYHEFTSTFAGEIQINSPLSVETGVHHHLYLHWRTCYHYHLDQRLHHCH